jgi:hypothetical protein
MATIIKRTNPSGKVVYRVEYRIKGQKSVSKTFPTKKMAEDFVKVTDVKLIHCHFPKIEMSKVEISHKSL